MIRLILILAVLIVLAVISWWVYSSWQRQEQRVLQPEPLSLEEAGAAYIRGDIDDRQYAAIAEDLLRKDRDAGRTR